MEKTIYHEVFASRAFVVFDVSVLATYILSFINPSDISKFLDNICLAEKALLVRLCVTNTQGKVLPPIRKLLFSADQYVWSRYLPATKTLGTINFMLIDRHKCNVFTYLDHFLRRYRFTFRRG